MLTASSRAFPHTIELVSVGGDGQLAESSSRVNMSTDGRYVLFQAIGLAPTGGTRIASAQWYLRDRVARTTELISQSTQGVPSGSVGKFSSGVIATIDRSGRLVAFEMVATGLDGPGTTPARREIHLRDRVLMTTRKISILPNGNMSAFASARPHISADGKYVLFGCGGDFFFASLQMPSYELCLLNIATNTFTRANKTLDGSPMPAGTASGLDPDNISENGDQVYFTANSSNLVIGDTNEKPDVFVYYRSLDRVERLSTDSSGGQIADGGSNLQVSKDGRTLLFGSSGRGLPGVPVDASDQNRWFVKNLETGAIQLLCKNNENLTLGEPTGQFGCLTQASLSGDGRFVVFGGSSELPRFTGLHQVCRADLAARFIQIWSRNEAGEPCNASGFCGSYRDGNLIVNSERPRISDNGDHVAFWVYARAPSTFNIIPGLIFGDRQSQIVVRSDGPIGAPVNAPLQVPSTGTEANGILAALLFLIAVSSTRANRMVNPKPVAGV